MGVPDSVPKDHALTAARGRSSRAIISEKLSLGMSLFCAQS